jgi:hypothetical protein
LTPAAKAWGNTSVNSVSPLPSDKARLSGEGVILVGWIMVLLMCMNYSI